MESKGFFSQIISTKTKIITLLVSVGVIALMFYLMGLPGKRTENALIKAESLIEQYKFSEARSELQRISKSWSADDYEKGQEMYKRITRAEIAYFIDEGDFGKAFDSAMDGSELDYYRISVVNRIPKVYDEQGASGLARTLASVVFPAKTQAGYIEFVEAYNSALNNLSSVAESEGKKEEAILLKKLRK